MNTPPTMHTIRIKEPNKAITMTFTSNTEDGETFLNERVVEDWKRSAWVTVEEEIACSSTESTENMVEKIKINVLFVLFPVCKFLIGKISQLNSISNNFNQKYEPFDKYIANRFK